jgi:hypothetical protein
VKYDTAFCVHAGNETEDSHNLKERLYDNIREQADEEQRITGGYDPDSRRDFSSSVNGYFDDS